MKKPIGKPRKFKKPEILYFDIETSHCIAAVWGGGKQYVGHNQILKDRKLLTIAYMWENSLKPVVLKLDLKKHNLMKFDDDADKEMLKKFMKVYEQADLAVAHNGRSFDIARLRSRLAKHQLPDIKPILFDDSYGFCKNIDFTFHKLDFLGKTFDVGNKIETRLSLWTNIIWNKSKKALDEMARYNIQDVILLRKVYKKLKNYGGSNLNMAVFNEKPDCCPTCGGNRLQTRADRLRKAGRVTQFQCRDCGKYCTKATNKLYKASNYNR